MPVWDQALAAAGLTPADIGSPIHFVLSFDPPLEFLRHAGPLGDVIPIPLALVPNVLSVGDVVLAAGLAFFVFASLLRQPRLADSTPGHPGWGGHDRRLDGDGSGAARAARDRPGVQPHGHDRPGAAGLPGWIRRRRGGPGAHAHARSARRPAGGAARRPRPGAGAPVRPPRPERLVRGALDGAAHQPLRRPAPPARPRGPRGRGDPERRLRGGHGLRGGDRAQPRLRPPGRRPRGPLGPEARDGRLGPPAGRDRARDPRRRDRRRRPRLPARLRPHDRLDLLPAGPDRGDPAHRQGGRAGGRQLGHLAGRLPGRRPGLPAGGDLRGLPRDARSPWPSGWTR